MLAVSLGIGVLVAGLWELLDADWEVVASQEERWLGQQIAASGIERGFQKLVGDTDWAGKFEEAIPSGSGHVCHVQIVNAGSTMTVRAYSVLASGYRSETVEAQASLETHWP